MRPCEPNATHTPSPAYDNVHPQGNARSQVKRPRDRTITPKHGTSTGKLDATNKYRSSNIHDSSNSVGRGEQKLGSQANVHHSNGMYRSSFFDATSTQTATGDERMAVEEFRKISSRVKFLPTEHPATAREHATAAADGTQGSFFIRQATKHRRRFELIRPRSFGQFGHRPIFPQPSTPIYILRAILYLPPGDIKFHDALTGAPLVVF